MSEVKQRNRKSESRPPMKRTARIFGSIGLGIIGFVVYWICDGLFDGYKQYHTYLLTWIAVSIIAVVGGLVWIIDERRHSDDDDD